MHTIYNIFEEPKKAFSKISCEILVFNWNWKYPSSACDGQLGTEGGLCQWINLSSANSPERKVLATPVASCQLSSTLHSSSCPPANILSIQIQSFLARLIYQMRDWLQTRQNTRQVPFQLLRASAELPCNLSFYDMVWVKPYLNYPLLQGGKY